ncbi:MAG: Na/Pi cotransporter family protein [Erysipelotrichaceae bacterium]|nr:Na/Pi cotransporter family protein [Erysipelotrichaceae bacterium]
MSIFDLLSLLGGLAMFLFGMELMGDGLKQSSSGNLKRLMEQVTNNVFKAFLLGLLVTALIQSSKATIVITSGLVAAGIITLDQSLGIIVGANVGTTVTGQIIRLMDINSGSASWLQLFNPSTLAPVALIGGIICIKFLKFNNSRTLGTIFMGFGILFMGLMTMTGAVDSLRETGVFTRLFTAFDANPALGFMAGAVMAFILQSASASVGILQAIAVTGTLTFSTVYSVIIGIYLGDCATTYIVCSIGAPPDQQRVGVVNVLFNIIKITCIFAGIFILRQTGVINGLWDNVVNSGSIANMNTVFNLIPAIIALPFINRCRDLSKRLVKDKAREVNPYQEKLDALNPQFFATPALALRSCYDLLSEMYDVARANYRRGLSLLDQFDETVLNTLVEEEDNIDLFCESLIHYLGALAANALSPDNSIILNAYYRIVSEFERLGDHAMNIGEIAQMMNERGNVFSKNAKAELKVLIDLIERILNETEQSFKKRDLESAFAIEPLEEVVDEMVAKMKSTHLDRLSSGECDANSGVGFMELLGNMERISDNCTNVALAIIDRVGAELLTINDDYLEKLFESREDSFKMAHDITYNEYMERLEASNKNE